MSWVTPREQERARTLRLRAQKLARFMRRLMFMGKYFGWSESRFTKAGRIAALASRISAEAKQLEGKILGRSALN